MSVRAHQGRSSVFVSFANDAVIVTSGEISKFASSPGLQRGFCARRGSTLTCSNPNLPGEPHFHVGAFADAGELTPRAEIFANEPLPWFPHDQR